MAGGLGGLGGFGNILGAIGQSLLTSPRENPFQGFPTALQSMSKLAEHQAVLSAMSTVAEKLGVPKELAASPEAMKLFIDHINQTKLNQLRQQAAQGSASLVPGTDDATTQPAMSVPGLQGSSGISTNFNVADNVGGLGGLGGLPGSGQVASATPSTGLRAAVIRGKGSAPSARNLPSTETAQAIAASAQRLGVSPVDLATVISYESGGTFSPSKYGGAGGKYLGLIQFGPTEQKQFGARPDQTVEEQLQSAEKYLTARGFKPGMGILDLYSTINAGRPGRYNASDAGNGGAPGTVADKVRYQMGPHRARALAMFNSLGEQGGSQAAAAGAPAQTAAGDIPLPPPRPTQIASNNPNMPLPSTAMQRVIEEARAKGIGQGGPDIGPDSGPGIGQSGAPLNQVAAGRARSLSVPIPSQTNIPATQPTPAAPPPTGTGDNRTKAAARVEFQRGMNILAASNGDPVLMKQAEIIMQNARKYLEPSDVARRVGEAGLAGTPVGRAIIGGLPQSAVEALTEQQIPGYVSPSTLEQKKYRSAEEERAFQHSKAEREFNRTSAQQQYQNQFGERKFANEIGQQTLTFNQREAQMRQQRELALRNQAIAQQTPQERLGAALNTDSRAVNVRAGLAAEAERVATEARARDAAAAQAKFSGEATGGAQAAEALVAPVKQAQQHLEKVVQMGGYGPIQANPVSRALNAAIPDIPGLKPAHAAEVERQHFDQAMASIGAAKAALINKAQGGGNMSKTEQVLARADLATLTAADPEVARGAFRKLNEDIDRALKLDQRFGLYGGEQQAPRTNEGPGPSAAPAPSNDGWIDFGNGVRVRRR